MNLDNFNYWKYSNKSITTFFIAGGIVLSSILIASQINKKNKK